MPLPNPMPCIDVSKGNRNGFAQEKPCHAGANTGAPIHFSERGQLGFSVADYGSVSLPMIHLYGRNHVAPQSSLPFYFYGKRKRQRKTNGKRAHAPENQGKEERNSQAGRAVKLPDEESGHCFAQFACEPFFIFDLVQLMNRFHQPEAVFDP